MDKNLKYILQLYWKSCKKMFICLLLFSVFKIIQDIWVKIYFPTKIVKLCIQKDVEEKYIFIMPIIFLTFYLLRVVFQEIINNIIIPIGNNKFNKSINKFIFDKISEFAMKSYNKTEFYNKYYFMISKIEKSILDLANLFISLVVMLFSITYISKKISLLDNFIATMIFICSAIFFVLRLLCDALTIQISKQSIVFKRSIKYVERVFYLNDFVKELKTTNIYNYLNNLYDNSLKGFLKYLKQKIEILLPISTVREMGDGVILNFGIVFLATYKFSVLKEISIAEFVLLVNSSFYLNSSIKKILMKFAEYFKVKKILEETLSFFDENNMEEKDGLEIANRELKNGLEFSNVSFSYDDKNYILNDICFKVKKGEIVSIVGKNGVGKTTLINLIMKFYKPDKGKILLEDTDITEYKTDDYRNLFCSIFQEPKLFGLTIAENILMREINDTNDINIVNDALMKVGLYEKVINLKNGINSIIGKEFDEEGVIFSGGEISRIVIARIYAQKCPFIIMDEAASNLDSISENNIFREIPKLFKDRAVIFISHNMNVCNIADKIYFLQEDGKLTLLDNTLNINLYSGVTRREVS